jgi:predicted ATPase
MFTLWYKSPDLMYEIGYVKIGKRGMHASRVQIPAKFSDLGEEYFSLGQDETYYRKLHDLDASTATTILKGMRDLAYNPTILTSILDEEVVQTSLLRWIQPTTVEDQFHRIAWGGEALQGYKFQYESPSLSIGEGNTLKLSFEVEPNTQPPSNIHALIGSNGVGKTTLLNRLARAVVSETNFDRDAGRIIDHMGRSTRPFANLISVSFSAFDPFSPIEPSSQIKHTHVSLNQPSSNTNYRRTKTASQLAEEFQDTFQSLQDRRLELWSNAIQTLETDKLFKEADINSLASEARTVPRVAPIQSFENLSAGHKIVLLTISQLANLVTERTLILIDEPETHLHPPLLSAFIRSISNLLIERNGIAIIATHSPVVLQEIPRSCVWKIRRSGNMRSANRPEIETFGENVGILTHEAFGLEVTKSGFHNMLQESVDNSSSYQEVLDAFDGQLGGEARAIVQALFIAKNRGNHL